MARNVSCMGEIIILYKVLVTNQKDKDFLEDVDKDGRIIYN
jgi:phosphohistidine swiveling domain-containing protein